MSPVLGPARQIKLAKHQHGCIGVVTALVLSGFLNNERFRFCDEASVISMNVLVSYEIINPSLVAMNSSLSLAGAKRLASSSVCMDEVTAVPV